MIVAALGQQIIRRRWLVAAGWVAAAVLLAIFAPTVDPAKNEMLTLLPDDAPSLRAAGMLERYFPGSAGLSQAVVVAARQGPAAGLTDADRLAVERLVAKLRRPLPAGLARYLPAGQLAVHWHGDLPRGFLPNPYISPDGSAAIVVVEVPANFVTIRSARVVDYIRRLVAQSRWPDGLEVAVTGSAAFGADYAEASRRSHRSTLWVTVLAVLAILLVVYRAPVAAAVVLGTISLAAVVAHLVLTVAASQGLHVGTAEKIFVYVLLYGLGVDYSLLYLSRFREFLSRRHRPDEAAALAWSATMPAIAASSGTDIAGLAMLSAASFKLFQTTGHVVPIALLIVLAAAVTLIPATAALLHRWLFWPAREAGSLGARRLWPAVGSAVTRHPWTVLVATVVVLAIPAGHGARIEYVYDALTGLKPHYGAVRGQRMVKRRWPVGEITPAAVVLKAPRPVPPARLRQLLRRLTAELEGTPGVADVRCLTQPLGKAGRNLYTLLLLGHPQARAKIRQTYVAAGGAVSRLEVILKDPGFSNGAMATLQAVNQCCRRVVPDDVECLFAGATAYMADVRAVTARDFHLIAGLVLAVVFLLVVVLLRDAVLSAFMVAATALSYLATLGLTHLFFVGLLGWAGLDWKVQIFLFVVLMAVGQDYNIFLAARLAEESRRSDARQAARTAIVTTGGIISSAGLIMAATLGALMVGDITLLQQLGFAFALGMLLDTFVVRPLLLPAFAVITGRTGRPISTGSHPGRR